MGLKAVVLVPLYGIAQAAWDTEKPGSMLQIFLLKGYM